MDLASRIRSLAPSLVNILSTIVIVTDYAGTKLPIYARITARHVYLSSVDLPPIFGPVTKSNDSSLVIIVSLGINCFYNVCINIEADGCLIDLISS